MKSVVHVGLLARAEKAAGEKDEDKMLGCLKEIPSKAWEIGKAVVPQVLLHYLKLHGMAQSCVFRHTRIGQSAAAERLRGTSKAKCMEIAILFAHRKSSPEGGPRNGAYVRRLDLGHDVMTMRAVGFPLG